MVTHRKGEYCEQESRITSLEEQVKTSFNNQDDLKESIDKLNKNQDKLNISLAELNTTFKVLQILATLLLAALSPIFVFLILELIKMIS